MTDSFGGIRHCGRCIRWLRFLCSKNVPFPVCFEPEHNRGNLEADIRSRILITEINVPRLIGADVFKSDGPRTFPTADTLRSPSGASVTSTEVGRIQTRTVLRHPSLGNQGKHRCGTLPGATSSATFTDTHCRTCASELSHPLGLLDEISCCDRHRSPGLHCATTRALECAARCGALSSGSDSIRRLCPNGDRFCSPGRSVSRTPFETVPEIFPVSGSACSPLPEFDPNALDVQFKIVYNKVLVLI